MRTATAGLLSSFMGVGRIFSFFQGGTWGFSQNIFQGVQKVVKLGFHPSKLKKQPLLLIISKSRGGQAPLPPPSDAHVFIVV